MTDISSAAAATRYEPGQTTRCLTRPRVAWRPVVTGLVAIAAACAKAEEGGGSESIPGLTGDTISVGILAPLSDNVAILGKPIAAGAQAYFQQLNDEQGGIAGKYKVRVLVEDVTYSNPSTTVQKYNKIKDRVAIFAVILGTDHVNVALPLLAEDNLLAVPSTMDAEWVRQPHLVSVLAPYQIQMINGAAWYLRDGTAGKTMCAMVMASGYGQAAEEGVHFAGKEMGFTVASTTRMRPGDQDFVAQVTQLKNARCTAVFMASLPSETAKILATASQLGFAPRWIATSPSWHVVLGQSPIADYARQHFWTVAEGGEWGDTTIAGMAAMLRARDRYAADQKPDFYFVGGYSFARAAAAVLEKGAALGDLSRAGLARALTSLDTVSFGGLTGTYRYGPVDTRDPPRATTIFGIDPAREGGTVALAREFGSDAARKYQFAARKE